MSMLILNPQPYQSLNSSVTVPSCSYTMTVVTAIQHKITHFFNNVTWYKYLYSVWVQVRSISIVSIGTIWYRSQPS